ncbi:hypothetical protein Pan216_43580 [Planctomycetes bacterium Pan216]|uniref:SGNH hydrolase-type esterase domain-containing protein n=1 Tax=Kolteria novifilia TaxID=2527975 RepID=A0A518B919_9BACT|nr:hypothetical protein Pan216_43580 [Planctomycetes bacterium Pan216]
MNRFAMSLLAGFLLASLVSANDAAPAKKAKSNTTTASKQARKNPAYAEVVDDPSLPRVLLIGDSISIGYTLPVREKLMGKANIHRIKTNGGPTTRGVASIDSWLGDGNWDLIHFNWGIHDVVKREKGGPNRVPLKEYTKNLESLTDRLKETGATLVWATTTPIPDGVVEPVVILDSDVQAYNAAAAKIMMKKNIATDDLYSFAKPQLEKIQRKANVHFTPEGSKVLGEQVANHIEKTLKEARKK